MYRKETAIASIALIAAALIGFSLSGSVLAAKHADQTINNAKKIILKNGEETITVNVNSVPGPKGDKGDQGPQGIQGIPGVNGSNGAPGPAGKNGINGTTSIVICQSNSTNPLCNGPTPTPTPTNTTNTNSTNPVTNGTNTNATSLHAKHK